VDRGGRGQRHARPAAVHRAALAPERVAAQSEEQTIAGQAGIDPAALPLAIVSQVPYILGSAFVTALVANGGTDALDAAFRDPPATSDQIVDPAAWAARQPPVEVTPPPADGTVEQRGTLGSLMIRIVATLNGSPASGRGWGGDAYVRWTDPQGRSCLRVRVVGDNDVALASLREALQAWATGAGGTVADVQDQGVPAAEATACR